MTTENVDNEVVDTTIYPTELVTSDLPVTERKERMLKDDSFNTKHRILFDSRDSVSYTQSGGYVYPLGETVIKRGIGTWYRVTRHLIGRADMDGKYNLRPWQALLRRDSIAFAFVKDNRVVTIEGDWKLSDLGMVLQTKSGKRYSIAMILAQIMTVATQGYQYGSNELRLRLLHSQGPKYMEPVQYSSESLVDLATAPADPDGSKLGKRAGTHGRPARLWVDLDGVYVHRPEVTPGLTKEQFDMCVDGAVLVAPHVVEACFANMNLFVHSPVMEKQFRDTLSSKHAVFNGRVTGLCLDSTTGEVIEGGLKGQFIKADLPFGVDFVAPDECIKAEYGTLPECNTAIVLLEPQAPKMLREDPQTITNNQHVWDPKRARANLKLSSDRAMDKLRNGELLGGVLDEDQFGYDEREFMKRIKFRAVDLLLHGVDYRSSRWMANQLGETWARSMRLGDPNSTRIPVNWGARMQLVAASVINMMITSENETRIAMGETPMPEFKVDRGEQRFFFRRGMLFAVVNDLDFVEKVYPNHGGPDADDFYGLRFGFVKVNLFWFSMYIPLVLDMRSPNTRGEWTVWSVRHSEVMKVAEKFQFEGTMPVFNRTSWPKQLTQAVEDGDITIIPLPSEEDPDTYTADDDRVAAQKWSDSLLEKVAKLGEKGTTFDTVLLNRIRQGIVAAEVLAHVQGKPLDRPGAHTKALQLINEQAKETAHELDEYISSLPVPEFLDWVTADLGMVNFQKAPELGDTEIRRDNVLSAAQWARRGANAAFAVMREVEQVRLDMQEGHLLELVATGVMSETEMYEEMEALENQILSLCTEEAAQRLLHFVTEGTGPERHVRALALWKVFLATPSDARKEKGLWASDHMVMSTDVYTYVKEALIFFGIAHLPWVNEETGTLEVIRAVTLAPNEETGKPEWDLECRLCGAEGHIKAMKSLQGFWERELTCTTCAS